VNRLRGIIGILVVAAVIGACGSGGGPGATSGPGSTKTTGNGSGSGNGGATAGPAAGSGATVRLVNVWGEVDKLGPTVIVRVQRANPELVLLSAAPGTVTDFVEVPAARFGDGPADLEVIVEGATDGIRPGDLAAGDRVTLVVHGEIASGGGDPIMRVQPIWEKGEPYYGLPWPTGDPSAGVINVITGPLFAFPDGKHTVAVRTDTGACLLDPTFNEPEDGGFGGTGNHFLLLEDQGPVKIDVSSTTVSGCVKLDPDIGTADIDTTGGKRFTLITWGMQDDLELLTIDMGTP
jgi:hypothetical protein